MSNHTPEPWVISEKNKVRLDCAYIVRPVDDKNYEYGAVLAATSQGDARRIVACVNACAGMRNDELEGGLLVGVMQAKIDRLEMQRDELLIELEKAKAEISNRAVVIDAGSNHDCLLISNTERKLSAPIIVTVERQRDEAGEYLAKAKGGEA